MRRIRRSSFISLDMFSTEVYNQDSASAYFTVLLITGLDVVLYTSTVNICSTVKYISVSRKTWQGVLAKGNNKLYSYHPKLIIFL